MQQKSNAAFFKNSRCAATKLDREPITGESDPAMSFGDRTNDGFSRTGAAGNPASEATDPLEGV